MTTGLARLSTRSRGFVTLLALSAATLGLCVLLKDASHLVRLFVGVVAGLFVPALTYFRGFAAVTDRIVRTGATFVSLLASWTATSTLVLSIGSSLTSRTAWTVLAVVDLTALLSYLVLAPRTTRSLTCPPEDHY